MPPVQSPTPTPVAPTQVPQGQVDPRLIAILRARAQAGFPGSPGAATAPNGLRTPGPMPMPAPNTARVMARPPSGSNPAAAVMKAAQTAQSPLVSDEGTRGLAKALISKLLQHM